MLFDPTTGGELHCGEKQGIRTIQISHQSKLFFCFFLFAIGIPLGVSKQKKEGKKTLLFLEINKL
jgi:hypothetical protein